MLDSKGQVLDGSKTYKLHLPPNPPAKDFWAVTMYDTQTRSQLQTDQQFPTLGSQDQGIKKNADGSYDIYFAPKPPQGKEGNWLQTIPGKSWWIGLRIYGPLQPWIDKTWRPGEIELVEYTHMSMIRKTWIALGLFLLVATSAAAQRVGEAIDEAGQTAGTRNVFESAGVKQTAADFKPAPDKIETNFGTLEFEGGAFPTKASTQKIYDELDLQRATQAYMDFFPALSLYAIIKSQIRDFGFKSASDIGVMADFMKPSENYLTGNDVTVYAFASIDLKVDGATVVEIPPGMYGNANDAAFKYLTDFGPTGPDKGKGGKYLFLPPGYEGKEPSGYFVFRSPGYRIWAMMRGFGEVGNGDQAVPGSRSVSRSIPWPPARGNIPPPMLPARERIRCRRKTVRCSRCSMRSSSMSRRNCSTRNCSGGWQHWASRRASRSSRMRG